MRAVGGVTPDGKPCPPRLIRPNPLAWGTNDRDIWCDSCGVKHLPVAVEVDSPNEAEYGPSRYCVSCVRSMAALVEDFLDDR